MTLVLAWSQEEAARYLETLKAFEHKDASLIQKKKEVTFHDQVAVSLGCVRSVTKTDASQLLSSFTTMRKILNADMEELRLIPGIGDKKVKRLYDAFHKPFSIGMAKKRKLEQERQNKNQEGQKEEESIDGHVHRDDTDSKQGNN
jgi:DNA excision repair protein ERCC-1